MNQQSRTVFKSGALLVSAIALTSLISSPARANNSVACSTNNLSGANDCLGSFSGNDANSDLSGSFGINDWQEFSKIDLDEDDSYSNSNLTVGLGEGDEDEEDEDEDENEAIQGSWQLNGLNANSDYMVALKGGPSYSLYYLGRGETTAGGSWNTEGLAKGNGKPSPGLSHFTVYKGNSQAVPEPTTILGVMLAGGIGAWCKNKCNQS